MMLNLEAMKLKNFLHSLLGLSLILVLVACSDDPSVDSNPKEQVVPLTEEGQSKTPDNIEKGDGGNKSLGGQVADDEKAIERMNELGFLEFDLEVKYANTEEYDLDFEQQSNDGDYKAELHDTVNNQNKKVKGMEAFLILYNQMKDANIDANTPQETVIQTVLESLHLPENYTEFDLDITFKDGTKLDIEDHK